MKCYQLNIGQEMSFKCPPTSSLRLTYQCSDCGYPKTNLAIKITCSLFLFPSTTSFPPTPPPTTVSPLPPPPPPLFNLFLLLFFFFSFLICYQTVFPTCVYKHACNGRPRPAQDGKMSGVDHNIATETVRTPSAHRDLAVAKRHVSCTC